MAKARSWACLRMIERDFEFASRAGIAIETVVKSATGAYETVTAPWQDAYGEHGITVNSGEFSGLTFQAAVDAIAAALEARGIGRKRVQFRLRDWGISRQRYWGCPIPLIHCATCGTVPVPDAQLPVVLPENLVPDGSGNPLRKDAVVLRMHLPEVRGRGAPRNRHHGYLRGLLVVLPALRELRRRAGHGG